MPMIRGKIEPQVESAKPLRNWQNRFANEIAPTADLQVTGESFQIMYSQSWAVESLKHRFELEVHRAEPAALVSWI